MFPKEIINIIIGIISSSIITALSLLWFFIKNPEKIEKWFSMFLKLAAYFSEKAEKGYMSTNIQASVDLKRKGLGMGGDVLSYGVKIEWTDQESVEVDLKENKVVVMMRPFRSQAKNFASVISIYVPRALLPRSRRYVESNLMTGIDFTISKTFLEGNPTALQYFVEREIEKHLETVKSDIEKLDPIHSIGHLTRILIPELQNLSSLYPIETTLEIQTETRELMNLLYDFETIEPGKEARTIFSGEYLKMAVVPVGKEEKLTFSGIQPHLYYIKNLLDNGIIHFYIVSAGRNNVFAKLLAERACRECNLSIIFSEEYEGIFRGRKRKMFCALCSKVYNNSQ